MEKLNRVETITTGETSELSVYFDFKDYEVFCYEKGITIVEYELDNEERIDRMKDPVVISWDEFFALVKTKQTVKEATDE